MLASWQTVGVASEATAAYWARRWPGHGVGLVMGQGDVALDVDAKVVGGVSGYDSLAELEREHGQLPETVTARTGGGGMHYVFRVPQDVTVPNSVRVRPGLDVRGDRGQIAVWPTVHPDTGKQYEWLPGCAPWEREPAECPAWLLQLMRGARAASRSSTSTTSRDLPTLSIEELKGIALETPTPLGLVRAAEAQTTLAVAVQGQRHEVALAQARAMGASIVGGDLSIAEAWRAFSAGAKGCGLDQDRAENLVQTFRDGLIYGARKALARRQGATRPPQAPAPPPPRTPTCGEPTCASRRCPPRTDRPNAAPPRRCPHTRRGQCGGEAAARVR